MGEIPQLNLMCLNGMVTGQVGRRMSVNLFFFKKIRVTPGKIFKNPGRRNLKQSALRNSVFISFFKTISDYD